MAIQDGSTLVINTGNYFLAPVGTEAPADLLAPGKVWENVGHTSLEDIFSLTSDGGEATVLGTLQSKSLRTSYSSRTETMRFTLQQFDSASLRLFFGRNMKETNDERFLGVPQSPQPTQVAFLAVFIDGENMFSFYAPKVEILRGDDMELSDTESLAGLPLDVKPMIYTPPAGVANTWAWAVSPIDPAPAPTGATAGKPGAFTPVGSATPNNISLLTSVKASPTTAWTVGQHVTLTNGTTAYWSGTAWEPGEAP